MSLFAFTQIQGSKFCFNCNNLRYGEAKSVLTLTVLNLDIPVFKKVQIKINWFPKHQHMRGSRNFRQGVQTRLTEKSSDIVFWFNFLVLNLFYRGGQLLF